MYTKITLPPSLSLPPLSLSPLPLSPSLFPITSQNKPSPPERSKSYSVQATSAFQPVRNSSHDSNFKNLAPLTIDTSHNQSRASASRASVNGSIPSIPVPVNRPEMDMLSPLSPDGLTTMSQKAARKPVAGMQGVSGIRSIQNICSSW